MADISSGVKLAQRLDDRYSRYSEQVSAERKAREAADSRRADEAEQARQIREARENRVANGLRKFDSEQRLRTKQLLIDLSRTDQDRQDAIDKARQADEATPRGAIVDILA